MIRDRLFELTALALLAAGSSSCSECLSCCASCCGPAKQETATKGDAKSAAKDEAKKLFDGKSLTNWKVTEYGGQGEVAAKDGELTVNMGAALSGVNWSGEPFPKMNYEVSLEALKVDGDDIFCGICFPVDESFCSFVCGGWGGQIVGLSCVNGMMADGNDTTKVMEFKKDRWYKIRLRVTPGKIQTWIDDKEMVNQEFNKDIKITLHPAMDDAKPFGIATYTTTSKFKNITLKKLP